ncbi:MAG: hypothetical protein QOH96_3822, partial [Blastocatellia bacterium]|nr:hypothetical protein [Blastocatellia bacterium]
MQSIFVNIRMHERGQYASLLQAIR